MNELIDTADDHRDLIMVDYAECNDASTQDMHVIATNQFTIADIIHG